jgi:hypothetical protein
MSCTLGDEIQSQRSAILKKIKCLKGIKTARTSSHSLEDWGESLHSSLIFEAHHTTKKVKSKPRCGGEMAEVLTSPPTLGVYL